MRFPALRALCAAAALLPATAHAWGPTGHRVTGAIAEDNLSGTARAHVRLLLGTEDLAEASTWPDDMRSDPSPFWQKTASPWHYVTVLHEGGYKPSDAPAQGDAVTALTRFSATLRDPKASDEDKRAALRFVVHIIGDLHQPLHVGIHPDRGGNDVKITYFGQAMNLHMLWDSSLIEGRNLSYSDYARWLERSITPEQLIAWSDIRPDTWMNESIALEKTIYPASPDLSWSYAYEHKAEVDDRLKRAGVRIAAYLNWLFAPEAEGAKKP